MLIKTNPNLVILVSDWLFEFEEHLSLGNKKGITNLFEKECHWRDLLAFKWHIKTFSGIQNIQNSLIFYSKEIRPVNFKVDTKRTPPRFVNRAGRKVVETIFTFQTLMGNALEY